MTDIEPGTTRWRDAILGALLALGFGVVYLIWRPPLYDNDGYRDRLYGLQESWRHNVNPHHLIWAPIQSAIAELASRFGYPTTVPVQVVGIVISCVTLFLFFILLQRACKSRTFAACGVVFVAISPEFWHLGLQNRPYEFVFLILVLYLLTWQTSEETAPTGLRLIVAGFLALLLALLQQAMVLLIPAATLVMIASGQENLEHRLFRGLTWGGSIVVALLLLYLYVWHVGAPNGVPFLQWATTFAHTLHSPSLYDFGLNLSFVKTVMGISGTLIQSSQIRRYLADSISSLMIFLIYACSGGLVLLAAGIQIWRRRLAGPVVRLIRANALFATSLLSIVFWSAFVFVWQPAEPHFWCATLFPALVGLGLLMRERAWSGLRAFAWIVVVTSVLNGFLNIRNDRYLSRNFPEPLLAVIRKQVGPRDIFIVLSSHDWFAGMDYDLLSESLNYSGRNPGLSILDYAANSEGSPWQERLHQKIESTLDSDGKVFVAQHLFVRDSYIDQTENAFAVAIYKANVGETGLYQQVQLVFAPYDLKPSGFAIGEDRYFLLARRGPS